MISTLRIITAKENECYYIEKVQKAMHFHQLLQIVDIRTISYWKDSSCVEMEISIEYGNDEKLVAWNDLFKSIFGFFEMNADEQFIMLEHLGHLRDLEDVFAILTIPIGGKKEIAND